MSPSPAWPELPYDAWRETRHTLHLYTQVIGKVKLALCPPLNEWWHVALHLSARGLATGPVPWGEAAVDVELDLLGHRVLIRHSDGAERTLALRAQTVAAFHAEVMGTLAELGVTPAISTLPAELPDPIPFEEDTVHASYDPEYATRWWRALLGVQRVTDRFRSPFRGKTSGVNFYWGGFDLSHTRFTGRRIEAAPEAGRIMAYAEDEENFSVGFWPGNDAYPQTVLYAYVVPAPDGLADLRCEPAPARYEESLGEFVLPYAEARAAGDPDAAVLAFFQSAYEACATLAGWDRTRLEGHIP
jgi:hypothetical protein